MEDIIEILSLQDLTLEQSRQYTTGSYDPDAVLEITVPSDEKFYDALKVLRQKDVDMKSPCLLPIATACLYAINTAHDTSGMKHNIVKIAYNVRADKINATKVLLSLCARPGASAYGVANSTVLLRIAEFLLKVVVDEINSKHGKPTKKTVTSQEEDDEEDMPARKTRRYALESETLHSLLQLFQPCFSLYEQRCAH